MLHQITSFLACRQHIIQKRYVKPHDTSGHAIDSTPNRVYDGGSLTISLGRSLLRPLVMVQTEDLTDAC